MELQFKFGQPRTAVEAAGGCLSLSLVNDVLEGSSSERWFFSGGAAGASGRAAGAGGEESVAAFEPGSQTCSGVRQAAEDAVLVQEQGLILRRSATHLVGIATAAVDDDNLRARSFDLYRRLLHFCPGYTVHRFWNFVPAINRPVGELDRYMGFCAGRADALAAGGISLPPASAVGTGGDQLCVVMVAGTQPLQAVENPLQVPAYRYPRRYGPKSPSFARAGRVGDVLLISGTASIRASESLHADDPLAQAELALDNLRQVASAAGMPRACDADCRSPRLVRVYVRQPQVWPRLRALISERLLGEHALFSVVQADICRAELAVEIEAFARGD